MADALHLDAVGQKRQHSKAKRIALEILAIILVIIVLSPFAIVLFNSAKTFDHITRDPLSLPSDWSNLSANISAVMNDPTTDFLGAFLDSVIITAVSLVVIIIFSSMAAWVLVRNRSRFSNFVFMLFVAAMVIPFQVVMYPLVYFLKTIGDVLGIKMLATYQGIAFSYLGFGCSLSIFIFHGFIKTVPLALEESAFIDGCSQPGVFFKIILPLLTPTITTVAILNGIWIWNDYLLPLLVLGGSGVIQTIPLAVTAFAGAYVKQWNLIMTSALLAMIPIVVMFLFAQKYIIQGMVEGAVK
ncbi:MAG: carbohydrate ABC transporter permease [Christensenellales bacterium]|jgi:raffinose/stachyose/melibiose transport system permease protein